MIPSGVIPSGADCVRSPAVSAVDPGSSTSGLCLHPFRALRPVADAAHLGRLLCPPYDVIDAAERAALLAADPDNAVALILPEAPAGTDPYRQAAERLDAGVAAGRYAIDDQAALYVYEMS